MLKCIGMVPSYRPGFPAMLLHNPNGFALDLGFVLEHTVDNLVC